jgi:hypothetical protein
VGDDPARQPTSLLDPVYSPIDAIHSLDHTYAVMIQDFSQNSPGDAWTKGGEGSKSVDHLRRLLVHSPDEEPQQPDEQSAEPGWRPVR